LTLYELCTECTPTVYLYNLSRMIELSGIALNYSRTFSTPLPRSSEKQALILNGRRDTTAIIYEILSLATSFPSKTHIVYKANLNFKLGEQYIGFLLNKGLLRKEVGIKGITVYGLTAQGERLLSFLEEVERSLSSTPSSLGAAPSIYRRSSLIASPFDKIEDRALLENRR
jgi:predicted transcriptional regulator